MKRSEKEAVISALTEEINSYNHFYLADIAGLDAQNTSKLRRLCHSKEVKMVVVKNTLLQKAIENSEKEASELYISLKGNTSMMLSQTGNMPAKLIKEFNSQGNEKPVLKAAYVEESVYVGADNLEALVGIKSKEELIGDVISLLQSPAKNVISALKSGGNTISGLLKSLEEREA